MYTFKKLTSFLSMSSMAFTMMILGGSADAATVELDLTSGVFSNQVGASNDTYDEDGFRLQMKAGDHMDPGFGGDIGFHDGPVNSAETFWTLTFGGSAFDLLQIEVASFPNSGVGFTATGSNGAFQSIVSTGLINLVGFTNVASVTFDLIDNPATNIEAVSFNTIYVDDKPSTNGVVPLPAGLPLLLTSLGAFGILSRRRKQR